MYYDTDRINELIKSDEPMYMIPISNNPLRGGFCKTHYTPEEYKRMLNKRYGYKESEE